MRLEFKHKLLTYHITTYNFNKMNEEIKEDNNCIVKAFENNPISILQENINNKKIYCFKASDIGKALNLSNIAVSIQSYDEDEKVLRKAYDLRGCEQYTTFLTSQGVYRLLYNSKKEGAKKFRKWAGNILDDIIFNESKELKKQLEEKEQLLIEKNDIIKQLENKPETEGFNRKPGYIYIANDTDKLGHKKIGSCGIDKINKRLDQLNVSSSTRSLKITHKFKTFDVKLVEEMVHSALYPLKIRNRNEWFYIKNDFELNYIINTINNCVKFAENFNIKDILHLNNVINKEKKIKENNTLIEHFEQEIKEDNIIENEVYYRGVIWTKTKNKWKACLGYNKKNYHLGYFNDKIDAAKAYNDYALFLNQEKTTKKHVYTLNDILGYVTTPRNIPEENKTLNEENKTSKWRGVRYIKERDNYSVSVTVNSKSVTIITGKTELEAAKFYNQQVLFYNNTKKTNYILNDIPDYITEPKDIKTEQMNIRTANKSSKYIGVMWAKDISSWKALLVYNKVSLHLGLFTNEMEAAKVYNQQALFLNNERETKYKLNDIPNFITVQKNIYNEKYKDKLI